jgi:hypothetical protein
MYPQPRQRTSLTGLHSPPPFLVAAPSLGRARNETILRSTANCTTLLFSTSAARYDSSFARIQWRFSFWFESSHWILRQVEQEKFGISSFLWAFHIMEHRVITQVVCELDIIVFLIHTMASKPSAISSSSLVASTCRSFSSHSSMALSPSSPFAFASK